MASSPSVAEQLQQLEFRVQSLTQANQRLYRQQEQFRTTFSQAAVGIVHTGLGGEFRMVNPTFCKIVGYGADELTQTTFVELTHPEDWRNDCGRVDQLLAGEVDTIDLEHRYCREDKSLVWVHATLSLVRQEDGAPDYIIMVVHDISDRKQAEAERLSAQEASRRTTSRLQTLIQNLQAGVLLVDDQERVVFTNQIFQQLFQLNLRPQIQQQVAYKSIVRAVAQRVEQAERFVTSQHHTLRDRQLMAQRPWQLTNGRTVEEDFIPIWMGEEYGGHLWLFRDITDRRRSDLALQQQYQQLLLLRRLTHEVRQTLDPQLMFQTAVDSIGSALKCDRCHLYLYPGDRDTLPCAAEYLAQGQSSLRRMMLPVRNNCFAQVVLAEDAAIASSNITRDPLLKDMVPLCQEGNISALVAVRTSYQNRPNGLLVIHQCGVQRQWTDGDLEILEAVAGQVGIALAQVKLLTQEKEQRQQLALQNQELETARKTAESASHAKGDFLATMSHEIRTPLNAVIGMTGLLMETTLTGQQTEWLEVLRNSSETLLALINDVLDYSKIESGQLELEERPVEVSQCVQESLTLVAAIAQSKDLAITHTIADNVPPVVMGDGTRLRQVLVNLLSNAVKFTDEGAITVTVTAREVPTPAIAPPASPNADSRAGGPGANGDRPPATLPLYELQFDVQDTGIGISAEQQTQLFKSFSQVDASITRRYGGTGLGLAICRRLTRLMQGQLWVDSELGQGSTFHFTAVMPQGASAVMPSSLLGESEQTALSGKQLWIIDDNPVNRQFLVHNSEQWGITVTTFGRAEDALGCLAQDQPTVDAMVVDWRLPGMNGIEFATALDQHPPYDQVPLVMLTAAQMPPVEPSVTNRFIAWLQNPIPRETLHEVLTQILAPPEPAEGPAAIASKLTAPASPNTNGAEAGAEDTEGKGRSPQDNSPSPSEADRTTAPAPEEAEAETTVNPLRILLAEDNPVNQKVALLMLERLGYQADVVGDGEEVLEALEQQSYSLILMDLEMPHMDGITAAKEIQKRYDLADRPQIVALTAYAMGEDRDRCLAAGMDDYITKPIRKDALLEVLYQSEHRSKSQAIAGDSAPPTPGGNNRNERNGHPPTTVPADGGAHPAPETPATETSPPLDSPALVLGSGVLPVPPPFPMAPLDPLRDPESDVEETQIPWSLDDSWEPQLDQAVVEGLLSIGGSNERAMAMVAKAVTLFCEDVVKRLGAIEQALTTQNATDLRQAAHALRSGSANLGANQLADYCNQLESLAREMEPDPLPAVCPSTMGTLQAAYDAANRQLKDFLGL